MSLAQARTLTYSLIFDGSVSTPDRGRHDAQVSAEPIALDVLTLVVPDGSVTHTSLDQLLGSFDPRVLELKCDIVVADPIPGVELAGSELWTRLHTVIFVSTVASTELGLYPLFYGAEFTRIHRKVDVIYDCTHVGLGSLDAFVGVMEEDLHMDPENPLQFLGDVKIWVQSEEVAEALKGMLETDDHYPWQVVVKPCVRMCSELCHDVEADSTRVVFQCFYLVIATTAPRSPSTLGYSLRPQYHVPSLSAVVAMKVSRRLEKRYS